MNDDYQMLKVVILNCDIYEWVCFQFCQKILTKVNIWMGYTCELWPLLTFNQKRQLVWMDANCLAVVTDFIMEQMLKPFTTTQTFYFTITCQLLQGFSSSKVHLTQINQNNVCVSI